MLQSLRSQRVGHDWVTELNWARFCPRYSCIIPLLRCYLWGIFFPPTPCSLNTTIFPFFIFQTYIYLLHNHYSICYLFFFFYPHPLECWRVKWQPISVFLLKKISWTEEPGGLQSIGSQRVGHDWSINTQTLECNLCRSRDFPVLFFAAFLRLMRAWKLIAVQQIVQTNY